MVLSVSPTWRPNRIRIVVYSPYKFKKWGDYMNASEFNTQIKSVVASLFEVADELDRKGVGKQIIKDDDTNLRDAIKAEILFFIFKVIDPERLIKEEELKFINECLDYDYTLLTIEVARKKTFNAGVPQMSFLLPSFIIIDSHLNGNKFSSTYVQTISYVTIGVLNCKSASLQETVKYCRRIRLYSEMIKRSLNCKLDFDPMKHISEEHKSLIKVAIEIDEKINKFEEENKYLEASIETIKKSIKKKKDEDEKHKIEERINKPSKDLDENSDPVEQLKHLIGLNSVKNQIYTLVNVQIVNMKCKEYSVERQSIGKHMLFTGNPGTGKTTVARLVGKIYHEKGIISKGHLVEVSRADLVGKYVGHTAKMVKDAVKNAKGGVLFIDEAYTLCGTGGDFGQEAIDTLVKEMENNRDDLVVIVAGYPALMQQFMESNPGLRSRFPITVEFPDYSSEELLKIFKKFCSDNSFNVSPEILDRVKAAFKTEAAKRKNNFGNARMVRNYFEKMIMNHANRLVVDNMLGINDITSFSIDDLPVAGVRKAYTPNYQIDYHIV